MDLLRKTLVAFQDRAQGIRVFFPDQMELVGGLLRRIGGLCYACGCLCVHSEHMGRDLPSMGCAAAGHWTTSCVGLKLGPTHFWRGANTARLLIPC